MKIVQSAGTRVIASTETVRSANVLVKASGRNIFPSIPPSANTGRNDRSMMTTEKKIGRPTSTHAGRTIARRSPLAGSSPKWPRSRCIAFSAITIDESTSTPIEIAIPASDMMLAWMSTTPSRRRAAMIANEPRTDSGSVIATMNEVRTWRRTTRMQIDAVMIASSSVLRTVPIAPSISGVRS